MFDMKFIIVQALLNYDFALTARLKYFVDT
jgi:hypothetical protein